MRNFLVFESQKLWFNIPGRENTMRNKSLIHTKDVKTQEGTPLHLEYYLINDSVLGGCAECYGVEILALRRHPAHHHARDQHLHAHRPAGLLRRHAGFAE